MRPGSKWPGGWGPLLYMTVPWPSFSDWFIPSQSVDFYWARGHSEKKKHWRKRSDPIPRLFFGGGEGLSNGCGCCFCARWRVSSFAHWLAVLCLVIMTNWWEWSHKLLDMSVLWPYFLFFLFLIASIIYISVPMCAVIFFTLYALFLVFCLFLSCTVTFMWGISGRRIHQNNCLRCTVRTYCRQLCSFNIVSSCTGS